MNLQQQTRRHFLGRASTGLGSLALGSLLTPGLLGENFDGNAALPTHLAPKCKRVIHLCMAGGPSHLETLDYKPKLRELDGKPMPKSVTEGKQIAQLQGQRDKLKIMGPQHDFKRCGKSGLMLSDVMPHIQGIADEICVINSMMTEQINHDPAHLFMNTGSIIPGRPSMGSWLNYGLGSDSDNLPGFIVLTSEGGGQSQPIAARQWSNGFLPGKYQGVKFMSVGDPVMYVRNPNGVDMGAQRRLIDTIKGLNQITDEAVDDPEIATRISQYEMAYNMQSSVPELMDFSDEPKHIMEMYGTEGGDGSFGSNCLLARRLAERGVRFIQLYHRGWDHHGGVKAGVANTGKLVDQGTAALIKDLKQRGMLEDTLVVWGGEFGRTPMAQGSGRDHHIAGFSLWMAGGGVKGGMSYGATDEFGYSAVEDKVHVHDLHATMLHLLGIDHEKLIYKFQGRQFRLTDVHGHIVKDILV